MKKTISFSLLVAFATIFIQSCYVMTPKTFNQISNDKAYNKGMDRFHTQSMQTQNLDSLYCNLNLFLETLTAYRPYFNDVTFSNDGLQNVKNELIIVYDKFRSGNRTVFKSELELREKIGQYITAVIDDAKSGKKNYKSIGFFELLDLRPNIFNKK